MSDYEMQMETPALKLINRTLAFYSGNFTLICTVQTKHNIYSYIPLSND